MNLDVRNLSVEIDKKKILKNVDMSCQKKKFTGIIGPNGSGKSTLLRTVYKSINPKSGSIKLGDIDILNDSYKNIFKHLSVVSQFNNLDFDFSVKEIVLMGRIPHKKIMEKDNLNDFKIVEDALKKVGLLEYQDRSFLTLSGGEKQRVILARAICQEPDFMILDEPTNHLDIKNQLEMFKIMKNLNISVLAALHDISMAARYCDYLYILKNGEIYAQGSPKEIINKETIDYVYNVDCEVYKNPINEELEIYYRR
ncbi:MAG: ABC transporter ATP-binding protein [Peptostreptococcus sp.]|uniref:ABC transporter ATP-binding protein n=1 Tax=Peptostreptococcus sp. TaxID=1262 RepID=UPI002FC6CD11